MILFYQLKNWANNIANVAFWKSKETDWSGSPNNVYMAFHLASPLNSVFSTMVNILLITWMGGWLKSERKRWAKNGQNLFNKFGIRPLLLKEVNQWRQASHTRGVRLIKILSSLSISWMVIHYAGRWYKLINNSIKFTIVRYLSI